jgi:CheY-like chemotaxis protein
MQLKILAVDHQQESLDAFTSTVAPLGFEVAAVTDGRAAAQRISTEKFDLVALAAEMPHLDGFELARQVRESPSNHGVPILIFTAPENSEAMRRGFALGVTFYLEKPLNAEKLRGLFSAARGLMLQQRRRYVRLPVRVEVLCRSGGKQVQTRSLDLSQGGILLESSGGLEVGNRVEAEFSLPGVREPLRLTGMVVRKLARDGMAIEFLEPEQVERAALQVFVADKTAK